MIAPLGEQYLTGPEPTALAVSDSGKTIVTANNGSRWRSLSVLQHDKSWSFRHLPADLDGSGAPPAPPPRQDQPWRRIAGGLVVSGEHAVYVAEGNTGRIQFIDLETGERRRVFSIPNAEGEGAISGDLALDPARNILYIADVARSRALVFDTRSRQFVASVMVEGTPLALALAPSRRKLYVIGAGNPLGRPENTRSGVSVLDLANPHAPRLETVIRADNWPPSGPAGILATENGVFISNPEDDSITILDPGANRIVSRIPIRMQGFEPLRGVLPMGMAYDAGTGWLLVAEAGINAVAVIDTHYRNVLGHIPAAWFPTQVALSRGTLYVLNRNGQGSGPDPRGEGDLPGSISMFPLPHADELPALTQFVREAAGLVDRPGRPRPLPRQIRHVVLVVKEGRSFDEVLGDVTRASGSPVMAAPQLARFGSDGFADGERQRLSLHHVNVTPNHHAIAARWTFSDNFYADSATNEEGLDRLSFWTHLARQGISFARFGVPFDGATSDTERARRVIAEIESRYARPGAELPQLLWIHLPNDRMAPPRPDAGYPYAESYLADNDVALGRLLEYLSHTRWWRQMAVFVTEASAEGGIDHIDAHRTILLCAGPWARQNSVSHANAGLAALRRTIFRLLGAPPLGLSDAAASDLSDCFTDAPDPAPYSAQPVDPRLYRP